MVTKTQTSSKCATPVDEPHARPAIDSNGDDDIVAQRDELLACVRRLEEQQRELAARVELLATARVEEKSQSSLPRYAGTVDGDFEQYRKNFELEKELYNWSGGLAQNLLRMLVGEAREFVLDLPATVRADYEQLCVALDRRFGVYNREDERKEKVEQFVPTMSSAQLELFAFDRRVSRRSFSTAIWLPSMYDEGLSCI